MKKILLGVLCLSLMVTLFGCATGGTQLENIETSQSVSADSISQKDYENNLDGLVEYMIALNYIPKKTEKKEMLANIIGAKKGYKYVYSVDGSTTVMELYEYDPESKDENALRVINEVKKDGAFHVFGDNSIDQDVTYKATLSDNGKYLMLYTDNSNKDANVQRTEDVKKAFQGFYA